jgi:hypothetical protein
MALVLQKRAAGDARRRRRVGAIAAGLALVVGVASVVLARLHTGTGTELRTVAGGPNPVPATLATSTSESTTAIAGALTGLVPDGSLHIQVVLDDSVVHGGSSIQGEEVFVNDGPRPIMVGGCPDDWLMVGLANASVDFDPPTSLAVCQGGPTLPVGVSRFSITVRATYATCTYPNSGFSPSAQRPLCVGSGMPPSQLPPLPPGSYETKALIQVLPPGTVAPPPVLVTVLP